MIRNIRMSPRTEMQRKSILNGLNGKDAPNFMDFLEDHG